MPQSSLEASALLKLVAGAAPWCLASQSERPAARRCVLHLRLLLTSHGWQLGPNVGRKVSLSPSHLVTGSPLSMRISLLSRSARTPACPQGEKHVLDRSLILG